jgi:hypothetical protein
VVPLLKPGKRADELRSYRPVSLTSLLCRITERMDAAAPHRACGGAVP